jgi:hypothetical protein
MGYKDLYDLCQNIDQIPVSSKSIEEKVLELSPGLSYKVIISGLDITRVRGFFISCENEDHDFVRQSGGKNVIVLARGLDDDWRRFVKIKELMHVFDPALARVNAGTDLETLLLEMFEPTGNGQSTFLRSDARAVVMALALFCPEAKRIAFVAEVAANRMTPEQLAVQLRLPNHLAHALLRDNYKQLVSRVIDEC